MLFINDKYEVIDCPEDDGEYRVYSEVCDKLCIERFYKNHFKSQNHTNNKHKKESHPLMKKYSRIQFDN